MHWMAKRNVGVQNFKSRWSPTRSTQTMRRKVRCSGTITFLYSNAWTISFTHYVNEIGLRPSARSTPSVTTEILPSRICPRGVLLLALMDGRIESTGTSFTFWTGDMVYKPLAVRVALIAGFRRALPVFRYMTVVAVAVVMWESPQGFPRCVGRVESRFYGFPCFPYTVISMACFWPNRRIAEVI
jgi:hypothetical protein